MTPVDPEWQNITFDPKVGFRVETPEEALAEVNRYEAIQRIEIEHMKKQLREAEIHVADQKEWLKTCDEIDRVFIARVIPDGENTIVDLRRRIKSKEEHLIYRRRHRLGISD